MNRKGAAAAEAALKAYSVASQPAEFDVERGVIQCLAECVDLTEAPEDAVCSLVVDLMLFCEREKIEWTDDVILRAHIRSEHCDEAILRP